MADNHEQSKDEKLETKDEDTKDTEQQDKPADESKDESKDASKDDEGKDKEGEEDEDESQEDEDLDLDRAKSKIAKANEEAKGLRNRLREAEDKLKNAKTTEEVEAIVNQMTEDREKAERSLLVENVALKHKLPQELAELLKGNTREELEAHAKTLQKFVPSDEDDDLDLEGGLNPRSRDLDPDDPRALAAKYGRRGKRR